MNMIKLLSRQLIVGIVRINRVFGLRKTVIEETLRADSHFMHCKSQDFQ